MKRSSLNIKPVNTTLSTCIDFIIQRLLIIIDKVSWKNVYSGHVQIKEAFSLIETNTLDSWGLDSSVGSDEENRTRDSSHEFYLEE